VSDAQQQAFTLLFFKNTPLDVVVPFKSKQKRAGKPKNEKSPKRPKTEIIGTLVENTSDANETTATKKSQPGEVKQSLGKRKTLDTTSVKSGPTKWNAWKSEFVKSNQKLFADVPKKQSFSVKNAVAGIFYRRQPSYDPTKSIVTLGCNFFSFFFLFFLCVCVCERECVYACVYVCVCVCVCV
jgi:hypothetical protein